MRPETLAAQALGEVDGQTGAIIPSPPSTTYLRDPDNGYSRGRCYSRADNPTYDQAAHLLTELYRRTLDLTPPGLPSDNSCESLGFHQESLGFHQMQGEPCRVNSRYRQ
ncbi:MAG TPA: hypothetical protein VK558_17685 [Patescibacteria group bacterium]|nr:hypothetical protein [Patescibacteria group bacterium]